MSAPSPAVTPSHPYLAIKNVHLPLPTHKKCPLTATDPKYTSTDAQPLPHTHKKVHPPPPTQNILPPTPTHPTHPIKLFTHPHLPKYISTHPHPPIKNAHLHPPAPNPPIKIVKNVHLKPLIIPMKRSILYWQFHRVLCWKLFYR